tara:strand:- start:197 stop:907 length:711 start_codon:yes stop_codon:yes gene_type:complete
MSKNILIVGGTSGFGLKITEYYIKKKYKLFIIGRKINQDLNNKVTFYKTDILNEKKFEKVLSKIKKKNFEIIIHNIGGSLGIKKINSSIKDYQKLWHYNIGYTIKINNLFLDKMKKKNWGRIVHISSATSYNLTGGGPYSSAKMALNTYVKSLANEFGAYNVIASAICPGPIELSNRFLTNQKNKNSKFWKNFVKNHLPMKRMAKPEEILPVIDLLASEEASYCSGAVWNVDGLQK